jgi:hypothetical protein
MGKAPDRIHRDETTLKHRDGVLASSLGDVPTMCGIALTTQRVPFRRFTMMRSRPGRARQKRCPSALDLPIRKQLAATCRVGPTGLGLFFHRCDLRGSFERGKEQMPETFDRVEAVRPRGEDKMLEPTSVLARSVLQVVCVSQ